MAFFLSLNAAFFLAPDNGAVAYVLRTGFNTSQVSYLIVVIPSIQQQKKSL